MSMSKSLPNFSNPPLDEVVLGVQFDPCPNYSSIFAKDVWELYCEEFPSTAEHQALSPQFEVFGGHNPQSGFQVNFGQAPVRSRLWFISKEQNHLLQFQDDRLLLNWRRYPNGQEYPRFEQIAKDFNDYLIRLKNFFQEKFEFAMKINQAEVSYINNIPIDNYSDISDWFSFWNDNQLKIDGLSTNFIEVINDVDNQPFARLTHELSSVISAEDGKKAFQFALSFRGKPDGEDVESGMKFIREGRKKIVVRFCEATTKEAQKKWEKGE